MRSRAFFLMGMLTAIMAALSLGLMFNATDANAAKGICEDAVENLYADCDLTIDLGNIEFASVKEAVDFCENMTDSQLRACWTACAINNVDCGVMAGCIDECFDNDTHCGFVMDFIYDVCDIAFPDGNGNAIEKDDMRADCNLEESDSAEFYACVDTCAYDNWNDCNTMFDCLGDCLSLQDDDDDGDDDDDDDSTSESIEDSEGEGLDEDGGSACGM